MLFLYYSAHTRKTPFDRYYTSITDRLLLMDIATPANMNTSLKTFERMNKCKKLETEIRKMWHLEATALVFAIGTHRMFSKRVNKYMVHISSGHHIIIIIIIFNIFIM